MLHKHHHRAGKLWPVGVVSVAVLAAGLLLPSIAEAGIGPSGPVLRQNRTTVFIDASADAWVYGSYPYRNYGTHRYLYVGYDTRLKSLVRVYDSAVRASATNRVLQKAWLEMRLIRRPRAEMTIDVHRLRSSWSQRYYRYGKWRGVTYDCRVDFDINNTVPNCSSSYRWSWQGGQSYETNRSAALRVATNAPLDYVSMDVTSEMKPVVESNARHYGWVLQPRPGAAGGSGYLAFGSREYTGYRPRLKIQYCNVSEETCNGIDDDCDGTVDEGTATQSFDVDGDGFYQCPQLVTNGAMATRQQSADCDDDDASVPGCLNGEVCAPGGGCCAPTKTTCDRLCGGTEDNGCGGQIECPPCDQATTWTQTSNPCADAGKTLTGWFVDTSDGGTCPCVIPEDPRVQQCSGARFGYIARSCGTTAGSWQACMEPNNRCACSTDPSNLDQYVNYRGGWGCRCE